MQYFEELEKLPDWAEESDELRLVANANSGGGQVFISGKVPGQEGMSNAFAELSGKIAIFKINIEDAMGNHPVILRDPVSIYPLVPRSANSQQMKISVGSDGTRKNLTSIFTNFFMLPSGGGINKRKNMKFSPLTRENYWLHNILLDFSSSSPDSTNNSEVTFSPKEFIFASLAGDGVTKRYFRLHWQQRVRDILMLAGKKQLPLKFQEKLDLFSSVYRGDAPYSHEGMSVTLEELMSLTAESFPTRYTGIGDLLPTLLEHAGEDSRTVPVDLNFETSLSDQTSRNLIIFGAPGTGKSFELKRISEQLISQGGVQERVTFHPEYTFASFVGTYKPVPISDSSGNESISYRYVPGPFMRVLSAALRNALSENPQPHLLIIEEINRAPTAAVFGDVFQLLDRNADGSSEYSINPSEEIKSYLSKVVGGTPQDYACIKIPNNMYIWATMNSADQGVFPLDTAFRRRWDFQYTGINDNDSDLKGKSVVLGTGSARRLIEWNNLRKSINDFLSSRGVNEDKQIGPYFIRREVVVPAGDRIETDAFVDTFQDKVLMYLFDDAGRQHRASIFSGVEGQASRYSDVCNSFRKIGVGIFNPDIVASLEDPIQEDPVGAHQSNAVTGL